MSEIKLTFTGLKWEHAQNSNFMISEHNYKELCKKINEQGQSTAKIRKIAMFGILGLIIVVILTQVINISIHRYLLEAIIPVYVILFIIFVCYNIIKLNKEWAALKQEYTSKFGSDIRFETDYAGHGKQRRALRHIIFKTRTGDIQQNINQNLMQQNELLKQQLNMQQGMMQNQQPYGNMQQGMMQNQSQNSVQQGIPILQPYGNTNQVMHDQQPYTNMPQGTVPDQQSQNNMQQGISNQQPYINTQQNMQNQQPYTNMQQGMIPVEQPYNNMQQQVNINQPPDVNNINQQQNQIPQVQGLNIPESQTPNAPFNEYN